MRRPGAARHDRHRSAADLHAAHMDHRIVVMEFAVALFEGLLHPHDPFHAVAHPKSLIIQLLGIPDNAQHRALHALVELDGHSLMDELFLELFHLFLFRIGLHYNNHFMFLFSF